MFDPEELATFKAPRIRHPFINDTRVVLQTPRAFVGGLLGTLGLVGAVSVLVSLAHLDCEEWARRRWQADGLEPYSDEFNRKAIAACDEAEDFGVCEGILREQWIEAGKAPYAVNYDLELRRVCPRDDDVQVDFDPGAIVKLGRDVDDDQATPTQVVPETAKEAVTEDTTIKPDAPEVEEPEPEEPPREAPEPPDKDKPTVDPKGDLFGQFGGWAERVETGDEWATSVMQKLNHMPVGTFGGRVPPGEFRFVLRLCKNGKVRVFRRGGDLPRDVQDRVVLALEQTRFPKPPPDVVKTMPGQCAPLHHIFRWTGDGVH